MKPIGEDGKPHKLIIEQSSRIALLHENWSHYPLCASAKGWTWCRPIVDSKNELVGKAAVFDALVSMRNGFKWNWKNFFTIPNELEKLLVKFDLEQTDREVELEKSIVYLIANEKDRTL